MKQGGAALESSALANGRSLSAGSPPVPPVWNSSSSSGKATSGTAYIPSYTSWYPSAHQEAMQQPQLMWSPRPNLPKGTFFIKLHSYLIIKIKIKSTLEEKLCAFNRGDSSGQSGGARNMRRAGTQQLAEHSLPILCPGTGDLESLVARSGEYRHTPYSKDNWNQRCL